VFGTAPSDVFVVTCGVADRSWDKPITT